jgi:hypothetical protein
MSPDTQQQDHISKRRVVYSVAGAGAATVRRDHEYRVVDGRSLTMDVYYPPDSTSGTPRPAVLFVTGFPDSGAERMMGCRLKEMGSYISWAELTTTSGLVAITYTNAEPASVRPVSRQRDIPRVHQANPSVHAVSSDCVATDNGPTDCRPSMALGDANGGPMAKSPINAASHTDAPEPDCQHGAFRRSRTTHALGGGCTSSQARGPCGLERSGQRFARRHHGTIHDAATYFAAGIEVGATYEETPTPTPARRPAHARFGQATRHAEPHGPDARADDVALQRRHLSVPPARGLPTTSGASRRSRRSCGSTSWGSRPSGSS